MKYLKKWEIIKEDKVGNCDFETFRGIMYSITDDFDSVSFYDASLEFYYKCSFSVFKNKGIETDLPTHGIHEYIGNSDAYSTYEGGDIVHKVIDNYILDLDDFKANIDKMIENWSIFREVLERIENDIMPRFSRFDNFKEITLGFDECDGTIVITFELPDED